MPGLKKGTPLLLLLFVFSCSYAQRSELIFVRNQGQWTQDFSYRAEVPGGTAFFESEGITYNFYHPSVVTSLHDLISDTASNKKIPQDLAFHGVTMTLEGAGEVLPTGQSRNTRYHNYFKGSNPQSWINNVPTYSQITYPKIYSGIDWVIYNHGPYLKYDFIVAPGSDPASIRMNWKGQDSLYLEGGYLKIKTSVNDIIEEQPVAFQEIDGVKVEIPCEFVLDGSSVGFRFPAGYDPDKSLIIDPIMIFASYSGSNALNYAACATYGEHGSLYAGGVAFDFGYPTTTGAYQTSFSGAFQDVVISKYDTTGTNLLYATYLGGTNGINQLPQSMIVNSADELIIMGYTDADDFPVTTGSYDDSHNGADDIFLSKLNASGSSLLASTYVGGTGNDGRFTVNVYDSGDHSEVIVDEDDNVYVASATNSFNFPTTPGVLQPGLSFGWDGVVFKMQPDLAAMTWSTYLGGSLTDAAYSIHLTDNREVYVCGPTSSNALYGTVSSYQPAPAGNWDGYILLLDQDATNVLASTLFGTGQYDNALLLDLDEQGNVYITGQTNSFVFPSTPGVFTTPGNGLNYIAKFDASLSNLLLSSTFGGNFSKPDLTPTAFMVDSCGRVYYAGWASFSSFRLPRMPVTPDALQSDTDPKSMYISVFETDMERQLYGTFLGGHQSFEHTHAKSHRFDKKGILYHSVCTGCKMVSVVGPPPSPGAGTTERVHDFGYNDFPVTADAYATSTSVFNCNLAAFKMDLELYEVRADFTIDPGPARCRDSSFTFADSSYGGHSYFWDFGDGNTATGNSVSHLYASDGMYPVTLIVEDTARCISIDTIVKIVHAVELPPVDAGPDLIKCSPGNFQLSATGADTYVWNPPHGLSDPLIANPVYSNDSDATFIITATNTFGCVNTDTISITYRPYQVDFGWSPQDPERDIPIIFRNDSDSSSSFSWYFGDGNSSSLTEPIHRYPEDGIYRIRLSGINSDGCRDVMIRDIEIRTMEGLFVPSAFSPNGDGVNEELLVVGKEVISYDIRIYDRMGKEVFFSDNISDSWNGTISGVAAPEGVYTYKVQFATISGGQKVRSGTITLIR